MYAYCTSSHMSEQFKKWAIKYHFGWLSWPAKIHIKYCTLGSVHSTLVYYTLEPILQKTLHYYIEIPVLQFPHFWTENSDKHH